MTNLTRIRQESKLTQKALAELSGVSQRIIQHYEQGFRDINKTQGITLYNLAKVLGCSMEDLIEIKKETEE